MWPVAEASGAASRPSNREGAWVALVISGVVAVLLLLSHEWQCASASRRMLGDADCTISSSTRTIASTEA